MKKLTDIYLEDGQYTFLSWYESELLENTVDELAIRIEWDIAEYMIYSEIYEYFDNLLEKLKNEHKL